MDEISQDPSSERRVLHKFPNPPKFERETDTEEVYPLTVNTRTGERQQVIFSTERSTKNGKRDVRKKDKPRKPPKSTREHTHLSRYPNKMTCPNCLSFIETNVARYNNCATHVIAASLSPVCMCMIPYCTTYFRDAVHYCPRCDIYLGTKFGAGKALLVCSTKSKIFDDEL